MFHYGEFGFQHEGVGDTFDEVEKEAIEHSVALGLNPVGIWDADENMVAVVIEGEVFERKEPSCE
tara:strand:+ start:1154 stop:1348 length:195 start_codon:yes stop_codon:yes gene_type:complete